MHDAGEACDRLPFSVGDVENVRPILRIPVAEDRRQVTCSQLRIEDLALEKREMLLLVDRVLLLSDVP